jgi:hypothetical protein
MFDLLAAFERSCTTSDLSSSESFNVLSSELLELTCWF